MKHLPLIMALAFALSGCDAAKDWATELDKQARADMGPMTIVMVPGYKVAVDGQTFPIYGTEICPRAVTGKVFILGGTYDYREQGLKGCVVVQPRTQQVWVQRVVDGGVVKEAWRVEHGEDTMKLWTSDGKPVAAATKS